MAGNVRIVTDSTADIDQTMARTLGIDVVPIYVRIGEKTYRDGVDLSPDAFYRHLVDAPAHPITAQPGPDDLLKAYGAGGGGSGIVSIHLSSKISGTWNSAVLARDMALKPAEIEVVDSRLNSAGLALVVMAAARVAGTGAALADVVAETRAACEQVKMMALFDTMKYLARGGRVSPAVALAAGILHVRPVLTFRDGEIVRAGLVRSRADGKRRLLRFIQDMGQVSEMAVSHSCEAAELQAFLDDVAPLFDRSAIHVFHMGAALGVHGGPGVIVVAVRRRG